MSIAYRFFVAGILFALTGMSLGTYMGTVHDFTLAPVHAHLNLVGWVTFFLFGLFYRGDVPAARSLVAEAHFLCAALGGVLLPVGIVGAVTENAPLALAIIPGTLLTLVSMALFLAVVVRSWSRARSVSRAPRREIAEAMA